jgi:hypothetical protein
LLQRLQRVRSGLGTYEPQNRVARLMVAVDAAEALGHQSVSAPFSPRGTVTTSTAQLESLKDSINNIEKLWSLLLAVGAARTSACGAGCC